MKNLLYLIFLACAVLTGLSSCDLEDPDVGTPISEVITLTSAQTELLANGVNSVVLTATLGDASDPNLQIAFSTTDGTFLENGETTYSVAASGKTATATLISSDIADDEVAVTASVTALNDATLVFRTSQTLMFVPALPDDILLTSPQNSFSQTDLTGVVLTATLFRDIGQASQNTRVSFKAIPLDSAMVELTPFAFTGMNKTATSTVTSANQKTGRVAIVAEVPTQDGGAVRDTLELVVVE